ncbi:MAG: peroxiredoxin-like family protein [Pirellulaceae bacterium]
MIIRLVLVAVFVLGGWVARGSAAETAGRTPMVGETAPDFSLQDLAGKTVRLKELYGQGPVVVVVLRGWPGYQCPICTRQVADLLKRAPDFAKANGRVVLIYPGPADDLDQHAKEFVTGKAFPTHFQFVTDPGYRFTNAYGLRWDAPNETAYPASFVIAQGGKVKFGRVSRSHGGRVPTEELLGQLTGQ